MRPHFGALFCTWVVGSLSAGLISTLQGNVENLVGDGTPIGILDATAGWLVFTSPVSALIVGFFFLPIALLLEWKGVRFVAAYIAASLAAVALFIALFFGASALPHGLAVLGLPGMLGGATWWMTAVWSSEPNEAQGNA